VTHPPSEQVPPGPDPTQKDQPAITHAFPGTVALIAFTALIFLAQWLLSQFVGFDPLLVFGAKTNSAILEGELWRFVTPLFLHASLTHLFVNMYSLYALGPPIERMFGTGRMLATYLLSGVNGVIFSLAFTPSPSVGSSGAIFGLLGALGFFLYLHRQAFGARGRLYLRRIILVALLNLGLGLLPQIDNWGHLGGLLAGAALAWWLGPRLELRWPAVPALGLTDRQPPSQVWPKALLAALLLTLLAAAVMASPLPR
jgi:rhomboid protease GluP